MIIAIIIILSALWLLGYAPVSGITIPDLALFTINNNVISLWDVLILAVIGWAIGILPRPLQMIGSVLLLLWILSVLGIFAFTGLSNIIVLVIIIGLIMSLFI